MAKVCLFILIGATAGFGTFLACGYGQDDRGITGYDWELSIIAHQLADLEEMLGEYRKTHGRYPTNDEGLAVLDTFAARFAVPSERDPAGDWPRYAEYGRFFWQASQDCIRRYREETGHVPRNHEELIAAQGSVPDRHAPPAVFRAELAVGRQDNIFLSTPAGALSPYRLPYVYENRSGLPPDAFADSPANDGDKRYAVEVDEGIYISAVGGRELAKGARDAWWEYQTPRFVGAGMIVLAVVMSLAMVRPKRLLRAAGAVMLGTAALGAIADRLGTASCYIPGEMFAFRSPELVSQQKELLRKYHAAGVINDATYARSLEAIDNGPATRPATQPTTKP